MPNTTDPRIDPMARYLCKLMDDDWKAGEVHLTSIAIELLRIADAAKAAP